VDDKMKKYLIEIKEKKSGFSFYYGNAGYGPDFLPFSKNMSEYAYQYADEETAKTVARRVVPHEALKRHFVFICEYRGGEDAGWYVVLEMTKL
jgi:hypothetical protein